MAHVHHVVAAGSSTGSPSLSARLGGPSTALTSDTVVFSHTKTPSRQSELVARSASPATLARKEPQPQPKKLRLSGEVRMTVRVVKNGERLGFGVRHDRLKRLHVTTVQGDSQLRAGDTLLAVNGTDLTGQEFTTVVQLLKATPPGELEFEIGRVDYTTFTSAQQQTQMETQAHVSASVALTTPHSLVNPWTSTSVAPAPAPAASPAFWTQYEANRQPVATTGRIPSTLAPQTGVSTPSIPVTGPSVNAKPQLRKRARPAQRAVTIFDDNGQSVNVTALLADIKKERDEKAALEEKNASLRKKLQRMLIENDEVRVRAKNEVTAAQEKAKHEVSEAQNLLAAARAQLRLLDRGPDMGRADSIVNQLTMCKAQLERLTKAEADRTRLLTIRYRGECRIADADAQRVLDSVVGMFQTKLRQVGRMIRGSATKAELEVACDGVRRLAFMKLFKMKHDFAFYASAAYQSHEPVHHILEQEQFLGLFGNSLFHEERAGLLYVATAPMIVVFDPSAENVILRCEWAEQNALREFARNFRL